jgi:ABC-type transporter Mla subunit MlaD
MPHIVKRRDVLAAVSRGEAEYLAPAKVLTRQQPEPEDPLAPLAAAIQAVSDQVRTTNTSTNELMARAVGEQSKVLAALATQVAAMNQVKPLPATPAQKPVFRPTSLQVTKRDDQGRISEVTIREH